MKPPIHVACLSVVSQKWKKQENFEKIVHFLRRAAGEGADVALTPAECLEGPVLHQPLAEDREEDLLALAEPLAGPFLTEFRRLAQELWMNLIIGFLERRGKKVSPGAVFLGRDGQVVGRSHQVHIGLGRRARSPLIQGGQSVRAFATEFGGVGLILNEDYFDPAIARCLRLDGAQILFNPTAGEWTKESGRAVEQRSYETGLPFIQSHPRNSLIVAEGARVIKQTGQDRITSTLVHATPLPDPALARELERKILARRGDLGG